MVEADGKFIRALLEGETPNNAYVIAYNPELKIGNGQKALALIRNNVEMNTAYKEGLKHKGLSVIKANKVIADMYKAQKGIAVNKDSTIEYIPDNAARIEAAKTTYKLYGLLKEKDTYIDNRQVTFTGDIDKLAVIIKEMVELKRKAIEHSSLGDVT